MGNKHIAVALSGGVDSAIAAFLLREKGYTVTGLHMSLVDVSQSQHHNLIWRSEKAIQDVERLCKVLSIPLQIINLQREFKQHVINYFHKEYVTGRTPNPCVICNHVIKFGLLLQYARAKDADYIATGHYARIEQSNGVYRLCKGIDQNKDQSYMLYRLDQDRLKYILFPLGDLLKSQVRMMAKKNNLPVADNPDSQDICFIDGKYGMLFDQAQILPDGDIIDRDGHVLGQHKGIAYYTIGQRHGLGINADKPLYVVEIQANDNRIIVGSEEELYRTELIANDLHWVNRIPPSLPIDVAAKVRYRSTDSRAIVYAGTEGSVRVQFFKPQRAITPGQSVVFYISDEVIGGGTIEK